MGASVQANSLSFRYPDQSRWAFEDITFEIPARQIGLLIGPSGSGKSTLALCLNGLIPHAIAGELRGEVLVGGVLTRSEPLSRLCQKVGLVFQDAESQLVMPRVREEIAFGLENVALPPAAMEQRIRRALAQVGLESCHDAWVENLSGGQQQRLALAAVLALRPEVLVLDEPTSNLDPGGCAEVFNALRELKRDTDVTGILIEHRLDDALTVADQVIALDRNGHVLAAGTPAEVFGQGSRQLAGAGIWLPATCQLALALETHGLAPIAAYPLSLEDAETMLRGWLPPPDDTVAPATAPGETTVHAADEAIGVENLEYAYHPTRPVLRNVIFSVGRGEMCALVGANGSGKTTLAKILTGLLRPARGQVRLMGRPIGSLSRSQLSQTIGYVFQNPEHQFVTERVSTELAYSLQGRFDVTEIARRVDHLLQRFDLADHADANPFAISQGEKRRLSVATMVALEQPILVLDEPTFGQDASTAAALMATLRSLQRFGVTILLITHDMQLVADYADRVAVIHAGGIIFQGPPRALFQHPELARRAGLRVPPLVQLGQRLGYPNALTVEDWIAIRKRAQCFPPLARDGGVTPPAYAVQTTLLQN